MKNYDSVKSFGVLLGFLLLCYFVAWTGAQVSPGVADSAWYDQLNKPSWNPPAWLFGPVWTLLYTLMAIAAWRVWKKVGLKDGRLELGAFFVQLILNGIWSQLFFGMQNVGLAFIEILILLAAIVVTTVLFFKQDSIAGWLMVPYIAWVAFASVLTGTIWVMN